MVYAKPARPAAQYETLSSSLISVSTPVPAEDAGLMTYIGLAFTAVELSKIVRAEHLRGVSPVYTPFTLADRDVLNTTINLLGRGLYRAAQTAHVDAVYDGFESDDLESDEAVLDVASLGKVRVLSKREPV